MNLRTTTLHGLLLALAILAAPALAWNKPAGTEERPSNDPTKPLADNHVTIDPSAKYQHQGHTYILERAIEILEHDGHANFAALARAHLQDILDGVRWADSGGGRTVIRIKIKLFWFITVKTIEVDLCDTGALNHYYEASTGQGLTIPGWMKAVLIAVNHHPIIKALMIATFGGLVDASVDVVPGLTDPYRGAPEVAEEVLGKAIAYFQRSWSGAPWAAPEALCPSLPAPKAGRSDLELAMFYLGWALHLVSDMGNLAHVHDSFIQGHQQYEDYADGKGGDAKYNASSGGFYVGTWSMSQFAIHLANLVYDPVLFGEISSLCPTLPGSEIDPENVGTVNDLFDRALVKGMPLTERTVAGAIWKFFTEIGIPRQPILSGRVFGSGQGALGGAYVFYRRQHDYQTPWSVIRTASDARYTIPALVPGATYWIRAAMPGFDYKGYGEFVKMPFAIYTHHVGVWSQPVPVDFFLDRTPSMLRMAAGFEALEPAASLRLADPSRIESWLASSGELTWMEAQVVAPLVAQQGVLRRALLSVKADRYVLGENYFAPVPNSAVVTVEVHEFVDVLTRQRVSSLAGIGESLRGERILALLRTGARVETAELAPTREGTVVARGQIALASPAEGSSIDPANLPIRSVVEPSGETVQVFRMTSESLDGHEGLALFEKGLLLVRSRAGVELEVRVIGAPDALGGDNVAPLALTTDATGRATFVVRAGNRSGRLRLQVRVLRNPWAETVRPVEEIEFQVQPGLLGFDLSPAESAKLEPSFVIATGVLSIAR